MILSVALERRHKVRCRDGFHAHHRAVLFAGHYLYRVDLAGVLWQLSLNYCDSAAAWLGHVRYYNGDVEVIVVHLLDRNRVEYLHAKHSCKLGLVVRQVLYELRSSFTILGSALR